MHHIMYVSPAGKKNASHSTSTKDLSTKIVSNFCYRTAIKHALCLDFNEKDQLLWLKGSFLHTGFIQTLEVQRILLYAAL